MRTALPPPHPLIEIAVEPRSPRDANRLPSALQKLAAADTDLQTWIDRESGQWILGGQTEEQLDAAISALLTTHELELNVGQPQVAYRETLGRAAEIVRTHKRQTGGAGEFAEVTILFEPTERGTGYAFEDKVAGGSVPRELVLGVEEGLAGAKDNGLLAGFPVIDFKATLLDAKYHDVDSSARAFEIAARAAFRELRGRASPTLLEPIMRAEVTTPEAFVGDVIGDLKSRRGVIQATHQRDGDQVIIAMVPLGNLFGYRHVLSAMTRSRARFEMVFSHYDAVPQAWHPGGPDNTFPPAMAMRA